MPTQEERLTALEQIPREYRPVLQNFAYELTIVKGLIFDQTGVTQEIRHDITQVRERFDGIETLLTQILARLLENPYKPAEGNGHLEKAYSKVDIETERKPRTMRDIGRQNGRGAKTPTRSASQVTKA